MSSRAVGAQKSPAFRNALRIATIYVVLAALWILFSDRVLVWIDADLVKFQTLKGLAFVAVTGAMLSLLCYRRFAALLRTEQALRQSGAHYRRIIETAEEGVWIIDEEGRTTYVNQKMARMLGYQVDEMLGRPMSEFFEPPGRGMAGQRAAQARDVKLTRKDGSEVWTIVSSNPITDPNGEYAGALAMVTDVTDRRRAEHLETERRRLIDAHRGMEQALGVVGHELRTPLASLRAITEFLLTDRTDDPRQHDQFLRNIHGEVVRLSEMVNNMLESARLGSGNAVWRWGEVPLEQVCLDAVEIVRPMVNQSQVRLEVDVTPDDLAMCGDADAIRRLVLNLLSNAARHTRQGVIRVQAQLEHARAGARVSLMVRDTGKGMPLQMLDKLGVAFALNRGTVEPGAVAGTGLGLAICKQIAAAHGGRITVQSAPRAGSTFTITMPADLPRPQACQQMPAIRHERAA